MPDKIPDHLLGRAFPSGLTVEQWEPRHGAGYVAFGLQQVIVAPDRILRLMRAAPVVPKQFESNLGPLVEIHRTADDAYKAVVPTLDPVLRDQLLTPQAVTDETEYVRVDEV